MTAVGILVQMLSAAGAYCSSTWSGRTALREHSMINAATATTTICTVTPVHPSHCSALLAAVCILHAQDIMSAGSAIKGNHHRAVCRGPRCCRCPAEHSLMLHRQSKIHWAAISMLVVAAPAALKFAKQQGLSTSIQPAGSVCKRPEQGQLYKQGQSTAAPQPAEKQVPAT
jgi:hypothetical protein